MPGTLRAIEVEPGWEPRSTHSSERLRLYAVLLAADRRLAQSSEQLNVALKAGEPP